VSFLSFSPVVGIACNDLFILLKADQSLKVSLPHTLTASMQTHVEIRTKMKHFQQTDNLGVFLSTYYQRKNKVR